MNLHHRFAGVWQILLAGVTATGVMLLSLYLFEQQALQKQRFGAQNQVREKLHVIQTRLESLLHGDIHLARGLVAVIAANPKLTQAEFEQAAQPLFAGRTLLRNIGAAPDMVIRFMHPLAGNEQALGLDYTKVPSQREAAERARDSRRLVLAGPVKLAQGGSGFVARLPVYVSSRESTSRFWGLVSVVLDADRFYQESGLLDKTLSIEIALRGKDGTGAQGAVFFGDPDLFKTGAEAVRLPVTLPYGLWEMAAIPRGGWTDDYGDLIFIRVIFAAGLIIFLVNTLFLARSVYRRNLSENALRRSQAALTKAQRLAEVGSWELNIATGKRTWSEETVRIFGLDPHHDRANTKTLLERVHPDDRHKVHEATLRAMKGLETDRIEYRVVRPDGEVRIIHGSAELERDAMGKPLRLNGTVQDITARIQIERMKGEFVSTVSHELRTPLTAITGALGLLHGGKLVEMPKHALPMIEIALNNSKRLASLVNDLLDMEKMLSGKLTFEMAVQPIQPLIEQAIKLNIPYGAKFGVSFEQTSQAADINVKVDGQRLIQVLSNFLSNAAKFSHEGGVVEIAAHKDADRIRISVIDHGCGIPNKFRDHIFEKFTQADSSDTRAKGGTGLGLAISKELIERMGGEIGFESEEGKGSTFFFEFPVAE